MPVPELLPTREVSHDMDTEKTAADLKGASVGSVGRVKWITTRALSLTISERIVPSL
jgi:hypothetical protein